MYSLRVRGVHIGPRGSASHLQAGQRVEEADPKLQTVLSLSLSLFVTPETLTMISDL